MNRKFQGATFNNKYFTTEALIAYSEKVLASGLLPEWELKIYRFLLTFFDDKDYVEQLSSGTTGTPKNFRLPKSAMIQSAQNTIEFLGLKSTDNALLCLPIDYIAGKMMVIRALVAGINLYWEEPSSAPFLENYDSIDFCAMVPMQVYDSIENKDAFKSIRTLIVGGSELRSDVKEMIGGLSNTIYETYGMAETCSHIALRKISGLKRDESFKILPGINISVDERNCLKISASYLEDEVVTNDVVELIDEAQFIWKGRYDNLINSGGIKINPEQLEASISKIIGMECAVIGVADKKLGQKVVLFVESVQKTDTDELASLIKENLPVFHIPREIVAVEEFPRNKSYKIDRAKLAELWS
ncbi:AMP-binding protein [Prolixibacteraceae bacterium Z1-6]|uniref:AMP-binding protein n=1 Tax=Draconibacterium aestuarii TaxID=2998507 RepID=A0A9X3F3W7_9BACT|nr:AMP-binding protein [Prolixibacteraceae bacterium Z1-6]